MPSGGIQLGANPTSIGKTLNLDRQPYTIIGVMPPEFEFYPKEMSMWTLLGLRAGLVRDPNDHSLIIFGKLRADVHIERAQDELRAIRRNVNKTAPDGVAEFVPSCIACRRILPGSPRAICNAP